MPIDRVYSLGTFVKSIVPETLVKSLYPIHSIRHFEIDKIALRSLRHCGISRF